MGDGPPAALLEAVAQIMAQPRWGVILAQPNNGALFNRRSHRLHTGATNRAVPESVDGLGGVEFVYCTILRQSFFRVARAFGPRSGD